MTRGDWGRYAVAVLVVAAVLLLATALAGCGPKADESSPCKGWESLPGATCNTT